MSARLLLPFLAAVERLPKQVNTEIGLKSVGLNLSLLQDPTTRVTHRAVERLLAMTVQATGERDLGLLAAEHALPVHLDVLEYAARSRSTLGSAAESVNAYHALLHEGLVGELVVQGDRFVWRVGLVESLSLPESAAEFTLAVYVMAARRITSNDALTFDAIHFTHARPSNIERHTRLFRCPIVFSAGENAIIGHRDLLDIPVMSADAGLAALLDQQARANLARLERTPTLSHLVRRMLSHEITQAQVGVEWVARRLGMSTRTLNRRLQDEGTTYRELLDDVRREMAFRYLKTTKLTVREIGYALGFTTSPAFHRAFRRWTGTTAQAYRANSRTANGV